MVEMLVPFLVGGIASAISVGITAYRAWYSKHKQEQLMIHSQDIIKRHAEISLPGIATKKVSSYTISPDLLKKIEDQIVERVVSNPKLSEAEAKAEIVEDLNSFADRLKCIEERFPEEAKLEKISSINDALLSERIDQLTEQVKALKGKALSKWNVAVITSSIIAGIFAVSGATYGVISFIQQP